MAGAMSGGVARVAGSTTGYKLKSLRDLWIIPQDPGWYWMGGCLDQRTQTFRDITPVYRLLTIIYPKVNHLRRFRTMLDNVGDLKNLNGNFSSFGTKAIFPFSLRTLTASSCTTNSPLLANDQITH